MKPLIHRRPWVSRCRMASRGDPPPLTQHFSADCIYLPFYVIERASVFWEPMPASSAGTCAPVEPVPGAMSPQSHWQLSTPGVDVLILKVCY